MTSEQRDALCRRGLDDIFEPTLRRSINALIEDVRVRGDEAVCDALAKFDGIRLTPSQLRVTEEEIAAAAIDPAVENAIIDAISHLRAFNDQLLERASDWQIEIENGLTAGEKITPISSVGLFVPSGKASYPSVAYQLGVPAVVAGVPNITLIVPPIPGGQGEVDPAVLVVCRLLGIKNVYRVNGPAGIAALGFGTNTIPKVRKVMGPGSPAVTIAQVEMQRHGLATMMLLGPTESLVIADHTAHIGKLAADLLVEAEHGTDSSVVLVCTSEEVIEAVDVELALQLEDLPEVRATAARASLGPNGGAVLVQNLTEAAEVANAYAPEHLQMAVDAQHEEALLDLLVNAGEILIGQNTPFSAGNFVIGAPASLPTSGFAHVSSGITVDAFLKRTAVAKANEPALRRMSQTIIAMSDHEGFPAHGNAIRRRFH
ncbi:MAG: histidinol dehydrogenase [Actinomycetota bacterium]|jgi:histidinol dehydrogenase